jgi:hypothetical protein
MKDFSETLCKSNAMRPAAEAAFPFAEVVVPRPFRKWGKPETMLGKSSPNSAPNERSTGLARYF